MKHTIPLLLPLVFALGLSACGKEDEPAEQEAAPATGEIEAPKTDVQKALENAREKSREAAEAAAEAAAEIAETAREKGGEIAETTRVQGAAMAEAANARAAELVARVKAYIENNEVAPTEELMTQLRQLKASLSESLQAQVVQLEELLAEGNAVPEQDQQAPSRP